MSDYFIQNSSLKSFADSLNNYLLINLDLEKELNKHNIAENNGCVILTIDSEFGNGKTFFLKAFQTEYEKKFDAIIYIDTWEKDYLNNPVLSIVRQVVLHDVFKHSQTTKKIKKGVVKFTKNLAKIVDSTQIASNFIGCVEDFMFPEKEEIAELKDTLKELIKDKKILFLIDELDRCRPNYAIDFLETIKHLFNLENTAFVIATNLVQLKSSAKALFGQDLNFKNYYRKFSPVIWQLPRTDNSLQKQYSAIFSAFCQALKLEENIKELLNKLYTYDGDKNTSWYDVGDHQEMKFYLQTFLTQNKPSLREIKSVFHYFFDVIKNLNITKLTKEEDKLEDEPELSHAISINEVNVYIAECLLLFMLTTIFLAIYKKIIGKEECFTKNIEGIIRKICLLTIDNHDTNSSRRIIAFDVNESTHGIKYRIKYGFSNYTTYHRMDEKNTTRIFNTLNSLIESGCSSNI